MITFGAIVRTRHRPGVLDPWREHAIKFRHEFREQTSFEDETSELVRQVILEELLTKVGQG